MTFDLTVNAISAMLVKKICMKSPEKENQHEQFD